MKAIFTFSISKKEVCSWLSSHVLICGMHVFSIVTFQRAIHLYTFYIALQAAFFLFILFVCDCRLSRRGMHVPAGITCDSHFSKTFLYSAIQVTWEGKKKNLFAVVLSIFVFLCSMQPLSPHSGLGIMLWKAKIGVQKKQKKQKYPCFVQVSVQLQTMHELGKNK